MSISASAAVIAQAAPSPEVIWDVIFKTGPVAAVLGFILWRVNNERERLQKENNALRVEMQAELKEVRERLFTALNNATIAITTSATTVESIRTALGTIIDHVLRGKD